MAIFKGTLGADTFASTSAYDVFYVNNVGDTITGLVPGSYSDEVVSTLSDYTLQEGISTLRLGVGANNGTGNNGANTISGNQRDNVIDGGLGMDTLWGDRGADTFLFSSAGQFNCDIIQDFKPGVDRIAVKASSFGLVSGQPFAYALNGTPTSADPTFIRMGSTGAAQTIYFDPDGTGAAASQILCVIPTFAGPTSARDFAIL